jgi:ABC-type multidrug transport system fused ATPase/permease subunit
MQPAGGYNLWHRRRFALAIDRFNSLQAAAESVRSKGALLTYSLAAFVFYCASVHVCANRDTSFSGQNASSAGLLLCYSFMLLPHALSLDFSRAWTNFKAQYCTFDRMLAILNDVTIPQEAQWYSNSPTAGNGMSTGEGSIYAYALWIPSLDEGRASWPTQGGVTLQHVSILLPRAGTDGSKMGLHGLSMRIRPAEKLGVIGDANSGKHLLPLLLFRVHDASTGAVSIDDCDITTVGLRELRAAIAIIPAAPVLMQGTLRENVDPLGQVMEQELLDTLAAVGLEPAWIDRVVVHAKNDQAGDCSGNSAGGSEDTVGREGEGADAGVVSLNVNQRRLVTIVCARLRKRVRIVVVEEPDPLAVEEVDPFGPFVRADTDENKTHEETVSDAATGKLCMRHN